MSFHLDPKPRKEPVVAPVLKAARRVREGEPCGHTGCLNHVTHPCEGCGRIAGRYPADTDQESVEQESASILKIKAFAVVSRSLHFPEWKVVVVSHSSSQIAAFTKREDAWALARRLRSGYPEFRAEIKKYGIEYKTISVHLEKF